MKSTIEGCEEVGISGAVRPRSSLTALEGIPVRQVRADICERGSVRRAMGGIDRLFHIAGTTSLNVPRERAFAVNVEGTRIVLEEALRAGLERAVYTSS